MIIFWFENLNRKIHKKKQLLAKFNSFFFRNKFSSTPTLTAVVVFLLLVAAFLLSLSFSCIRTTINLSLFLSVFLSFFLSFWFLLCTTTVIGSLHMRPLHQPRPQPRSRLFHNRWVRKVVRFHSNPLSEVIRNGSALVHVLSALKKKLLAKFHKPNLFTKQNSQAKFVNQNWIAKCWLEKFIRKIVRKIHYKKLFEKFITKIVRKILVSKISIEHFG